MPPTPPIPVLIVDDDADIREILRVVLESDGYEVYEAPNGKLALGILRTHPTGMVILLDLTMPQMSGEQVMETVLLDEALATRHAYIVMTAYYTRALSPALVNTLNTLQVPLLPKPFDDLDTILDAVSQA